MNERAQRLTRECGYGKKEKAARRVSRERIHACMAVIRERRHVHNTRTKDERASAYREGERERLARREVASIQYSPLSAGLGLEHYTTAAD